MATATTTTGSFSNRTKTIGFVLGLVLFLLMWFIPIEGLEPNQSRGLACIVLTGIFWIFMVFPFAYSGLLFLFIVVLFNIAPFPVAFSGFAQASVWMIVFSFILAKAIEKCGLGRRIGLIILNRFKKLSFPKLIITFFIILFIGNVFVPSLGALVVLIIGLIQGILAALGLPTDKRTSFSAGLICFLGILGGVNGKSFVSGVLGNSIIVIMLEQLANTTISWNQWFLTFLVMIPLPFVASYFYLVKKYKPEVDFNNPELYKKLKQDLKDLGPLRGNELITAILFLFVLFLWVSKLGGISVQMAAGVVSFMMLMPKVGVLDYDDFGKIQWGMFAFIGTTVSMGAIMSHIKVDMWLADKLMVFSVFNSDSYFVKAFALLIFIAVTRALMEGLAQIAFFVPVLLKMNILPPEKIAIILSCGTHIYQFPFQNAPMAISVGFGLVDVKDLVQYGFFISLICIIQYSIGFAIGWPFIPGF